VTAYPVSRVGICRFAHRANPSWLATDVAAASHSENQMIHPYDALLARSPSLRQRACGICLSTTRR